MVGRLSSLWWMLLVKGLLALVAGVLTIIWPGITLLTLVLLFGAAALADGVSALILGIGGGWSGRPWWEMVVLGLIGLAAGVGTLAWRHGADAPGAHRLLGDRTRPDRDRGGDRAAQGNRRRMDAGAVGHPVGRLRPAAVRPPRRRRARRRHDHRLLLDHRRRPGDDAGASTPTHEPRRPSVNRG